ncbi:MAG TPA: hypothetical protein VN688_20415 [Gemmataceae bacterium]|nr:hypothetical protein [Gemmataceae bacterium]
MQKILAGQKVKCPACGEQFATGEMKVTLFPRPIRSAESSDPAVGIRPYPGAASDEAIWAEERARACLRCARFIAILGYCSVFISIVLWSPVMSEWKKRGKSMSLEHLKEISIIAAPCLFVGAFTLWKRRSLLREKDLLRIEVEMHSLLRFGRIGGYIAIVSGTLFLILDGLRLLQEIM